MILRRIIAGWSEERGAIAPFAAIVMVTMIGMLALVTDFGLGFAERRDLQAATDAAALAAVSGQDALANNRVSDLQDIAESFLEHNGFDADDITSAVAVAGTYCADEAMAPSARFRLEVKLCPGDRRSENEEEFVPTPNAVRVETGITAPLFLSRVLAPGRDNYPISASATAARIDEAAFQAGTGIADLNGGIADALLSALLGDGIELTVGQYDGLLHTEVKALPFLDALATNLNLTLGTYDQLLQADVGVGDVVQAAIDVLNQQGQVTGLTAYALAGLVQLQGQLTGNPEIALGDLIDLGVWKRQPIGGPAATTALDAGLNLFQILTFSAQLANGNHAIEIPTSGLDLDPLFSLMLEATVIEPPQKPFFTFGPVGSEVHTAQIRLKLRISALDGVVNIPIYIEVGEGDARLADISCGPNPAQDAVVTVDARSGLAAIYVGEVAEDAMRNFTRPAAVAEAPIADVSVVGGGILRVASVMAKATVPMGSSAWTPLTFIQPEPGAEATAEQDPPDTSGVIGPVGNGGERARAVSQGMAENLGTALLEDLSLKVTLLQVLTLPVLVIDLKQNACVTILGLIPVCVGQGGSTGSALASLVGGVLGLLDNVLDPLLQALGLQVGYIDVNVTGVRCGVPSLVN